MKYWTKQGDPTTAVLKFYGEIGVWWNGSADFTSTLEEIEKNFKRVEIRLHCYGGQVFEGNVIYNAIARTPLEVIWFIDGVAASMGGIIPLSKGKIVIADNAFWMIHAPRSGSGGTSKDLFNAAKLLKSMEQNAIKAFASRTGKSETEVAKWFDGSDYWFDAKECLDMKLVDSIASPVDTNGKVAKPDAQTPIEGVFARYTALTTSQPEAINNHKNNNMDKAQLIALHGLTDVTPESSDTAIMASITKAKQAQDARLNALETAAKSGVEVQAKAVIAAKEAALKTQFTEAQKADFVAVATGSGLNVLQTVLDAIKPMANLQELLDGAGGDGIGSNARKDWDMKKWQKEDPTGLYEMSLSKDPTTKAVFDKLYKAEYGG